MEIDCVYTMGNAPVRLQLLALERSLRAVGCSLPIKVFPYDDRLFDLPAGMEWIHTDLHAWLKQAGAHPMCSKYYCLTQARALYTDADIVFLRNPQEVVADLNGFVVADTEWSKPEWTYTPESAALLADRSSLWLRRIFNAGHFIAETALYEEQALLKVLQDPANQRTCLQYIHDQAGTNLLVALAGVVPTNLNLPPFVMESTWAGDYPGDYAHLWTDEQRKPYLMHWAGGLLDRELPINELFDQFLTTSERAEWAQERRSRQEKDRRNGQWPLGVRVLNRLLGALYPRFYVQPRRQ